MLNFNDLHGAVSYLPRDLRKLMQEHPIILGGGYIRARVARETVSDIDLFAGSAQMCELYARALESKRDDARIFRTRNAWTVLAPKFLPVQFIHRWTYTDAFALVKDFDFTIARATIWYDRIAKSWVSWADPRFYPDVAAKRLTYCAPERNEDAGGSMLRVLKFSHKGYHISPEQLGKVVARLLKGVKPETKFWDTGEDERAKVLTALLRHVDPLTVIDGLEPSDDSMDPEGVLVSAQQEAA